MELQPILIWWILILSFWVASLPLTKKISAGLWGGGVGLSPTVTLTSTTFITYLIGYIWYSDIIVYASLLLVMIFNAAVYLKYDVNISQKPVFVSVSIFTVVYIFVIAVRILDPSVIPIHEHWMELAIINTILTASSLPPQDMWMSGSLLAYHHGGHLSVANMIILTKTQPTVAYNTATAVFYSLFITNVFIVGASLTEYKQKLAGALSAFFVGFSGTGITAIGTLLLPFQNLRQSLANKFEHSAAVHPAQDFFTIGFSEWNYLVDYFAVPGVLTQTPFVGLLHGELHANRMALTFLTLLLSLCLVTYRTDSDLHLKYSVIIITTVVIAITDFLAISTAFGLIVVSIFIPYASSLDRIKKLYYEEHNKLKYLTATLFASTLLLLPFIDSISTGDSAIRIVDKSERTRVISAVIVWLPVLPIIMSELFNERILTIKEYPFNNPIKFVLYMISFVILAFILPYQQATAILFGVILIFSISKHSVFSDKYQYVLIAAGAGIMIFVELIYVETGDGIHTGRYNTFFRGFTHAWILFGIASGVILTKYSPNVKISQLKETYSINLTNELILRIQEKISHFQFLNKKTTTSVFFILILILSCIYPVAAGMNHVERSYSLPEDEINGIEQATEATAIYGPSIAEAVNTRHYSADSPYLKTGSANKEGNLIKSSSDMTGSLLWYGPVSKFFPGEYEVIYNTSVEGPANENIIKLETSSGAYELGSDLQNINSTYVQRTNGFENISYRFTINRTRSDVEFKGIQVLNGGKVQLNSITVRPINRPYNGEDLSEPTIDGSQFTKITHPYEWKAIKWLKNDEQIRDKTILSAPGGRWRWDNAPSTFTGLTTVAGWRHAAVHHSYPQYYNRSIDVDSFYLGTPEERTSVLKKYNISYIYWSPTEADRYKEKPKLDIEGINIAYQNPRVTIYAVNGTDLEKGSTEKVDPSAPNVSINQMYAAEGARFTESEWHISSSDSSQFLLYGPYVTLNPGQYVVEYEVSTSSSNNKGSLVEADVTAGSLRASTPIDTYANEYINETNGYENRSLEFTVEHTRPGFELRFRSLVRNTNLSVRSINIRRK